MSKLSFFATAAVVAMFAFASVPARADNFTVNDFSSICGWSTNAVRCVVGDTVTLPAGTYTAVNPRAASVVGNVVTANEPGFTGIVDEDGAVGGVIVLPQPAGSGKVYIYVAEIKEYANGAKLNICDPSKWVFADGVPAYGWPQAADDVAILPLGYSQKFNADIGYGYNPFYLIPDGNEDFDHRLTFGEIYLGTFAPYHCVFTLCGRLSDGKYEFKRTDGEVPRMVVAGCASFGSGTYVFFGGYDSGNFPTYDFSQGVEIDMGFGDGYLSRTVLNFSGGKAVLPEGRMLSIISTMPNFSGSNGTDPGIVLNNGFTWEGAGIIRNDSDGNMRVNGLSGFEGSLEVGGTRGSSSGGTCPVGAGIDFSGHTGSNRTVVADGYISQVAPAYDSNVFRYPGGGSVKIGSGDTMHGSGTPESAYPDRIRSVGHVLLNGGNFGVWSAVSASDISALTTRVNLLTLGKSTNKLFFWGVAEPSDTSTYKYIPTNFVHIVRMQQQNRAQSLLYMSDIWSDQAEVPANSGVHPSAKNIRLKVKIDNHADIAIGGVIPWIVGYSWKKQVFIPSIDGNGYLFYDQPLPVALNSEDAVGNIWLKSESFNLSADKTVNSAVGASLRYMQNWQKRFLAGMTLTVASGAIALPEWSGFGEEGNAGNGTLKFGAPGYVFSYGPESNPGQLHTPMVAEEGLAFGYPGATLITGDQTGVKEELVLNGCTVTLGTANTEATFRVDMRVAGKGCLNVVNVNEDFLRKHKLTLDDCRNFPAKVNLASGLNYRVGEMSIAGRRAIGGKSYGSSESSADIKDDVHFAGRGTVTARPLGMLVIGH